MSKNQTNNWRGIILAGGAGTRLHPITQGCSKQLLPVYDKPMIYYPLSTLMLGGIKDIMLISTPHDIPRFKELLGDGSKFGISLTYAIQEAPRGLPEAFIIGKDFIGENPVTLILGDNLFYGNMDFMRSALARTNGATIFGYPVHDPERYGVVEFDHDGNVISLEEKPLKPRSRYAVPGLYCYDNRVCDFAAALKPSSRGELEILDLTRIYMDSGDLQVELMGRGMAWLDTGTPQSLLEASNFVASIENRQGLKIGCLEEIAFRMGFIDEARLRQHAEEHKGGTYGTYLRALCDDPSLFRSNIWKTGRKL